MGDDMKTRRQIAIQAFITRRGDLDMTQQEVADKAGVAMRTVQNFEYGIWPNPRTRARLERAVGWEPGEIYRLASPARDIVDPQLVDRLRELTAAEREWSIRFLEGLRDAEAEGRKRGG